MAGNFLGKWFGGNRADAQVVAEVRAELDRLAAERLAFAAPVRWLRELLPDLVPLADSVSPPVLDAAPAREKLASGVPSGTVWARRVTAALLMRTQPWLTSPPRRPGWFVPCRATRPSPPPKE